MLKLKIAFVTGLLLLVTVDTGLLVAAETTDETWFELQLLGEAAGSVYEKTVRRGERITEISSRLLLRVSRFGEPLEIRSYEHFRVQIPPTLEIWILQAEGDTLERSFVFGPDSLRSLQPDGSIRTLAPLPENLVLPPAVEAWFSGNWAPGETRVMSEFSADTESIVQSRVTAAAPKETWAWDGADVIGCRFEIEIEDLPELARTEWRDQNGRLFRVRTEVLGLELIRSADAIGSAENSPGPSLDRTILLPVDFDFESTKTYERIRFRTRWNPDRTPFRPLDAPSLRVISSGAEECLFEIERIGPGSRISTADGGPAPTTRAPSTWIESDDPKIIEAAERAIRGVTDPWARVLRLTRFVHDHVADKTYEVYFASARSTLESRKGDCTEHAVLLAALARATDIPARVVSGWIGIGSQMGYHLWTEVNVGGNWIGVDGVFARAPVDARYVPLAVSDLTNGSSSELTLAVLRNLGGLQLNILQSIESNP